METSKSIDKFVQEYRNIRPQYEELCIRIADLLKTLFLNDGIKIHTVEFRAKTIDSFLEKISRPGKAYDDPISEMPDLEHVGDFLPEAKTRTFF